MANLKTFVLVITLVLFAHLPAHAVQSQSIGQKLESLGKINGKFTFAVIGDSRSGDAVYKKIIGMVMERKPAFIINLGDVINHPS